MHRRSTNKVVGFLVGAALCSGAYVASAWEVAAPVEIKVHEHGFDGLKVWNDGCVLKGKVDFNAPKDAYSSRAPIRNFYRFKVRMQFADNLSFTSPVFFNRAPGRRSYAFTEDTTDGGCWAKKRMILQDADIVGCRGKRCRLDAFSD